MVHILYIQHEVQCSFQSLTMPESSPEIPTLILEKKKKKKKIGSHHKTIIINFIQVVPHPPLRIILK